MKPAPPPPAAWSRRSWLRALPAFAATAATAAAPHPVVWPILFGPDGRPIDTAGWQGVPVVVVFWATYCAFCERHNARIDKLHRTLDPARLRILGVAMDRDGAAVQQYVRRHDYRFPVVLEGGQLRARFTPRRVIPMTCTVDAEGRPRQCIPGEMAEDDVMELARLALPAAR
ncbi:MAG: TlpA disulfide reductase family protein [Rubrivivax sp.]|nr:TlpA disulfide reductase family protein [Rubrivivax sp.]